MKSILLILAFMVSLSQISHARLGETPSEIEKRFGKPVQQNTIKDYVIYQYSYGSIRILVKFEGGISTTEDYINRIFFTSKEINAIMEINAAGQKWSIIPSGQKSLILLMRADKSVAIKLQGNPDIDLMEHKDQVNWVTVWDGSAMEKADSKQTSLEGF